MVGKSNEDKAICLFGKLYDPAFELYYENISSYGEHIEGAKTYSIVRQKSFDRFVEEEETQDIILQVLKTGFHFDDFFVS